MLLAPGDQVDAGDVDREVEQEVTRPEFLGENAAVVVARQRLDPHGDAIARRDVTLRVPVGDDADLRRPNRDVPQQQRQHAAADAAEADHQQPAAEFRVGRVGHGKQRSGLSHGAF
jgi:hypothetical protein